MTINRSAVVTLARRLGTELTRSIKSRLATNPSCFDESNDFYGDPGDSPESEWAFANDLFEDEEEFGPVYVYTYDF